MSWGSHFDGSLENMLAVQPPPELELPEPLPEDPEPSSAMDASDGVTPELLVPLLPLDPELPMPPELVDPDEAPEPPELEDPFASAPAPVLELCEQQACPRPNPKIPCEGHSYPVPLAQDP